MKRLIVFLVLVFCILSCFASISFAAEETEWIWDWEQYNVLFTKEKLEENYYGDGVVNFRCAYSNWDQGNQEYLWLISDWEGKGSSAPSSLYLGDNFDMSNVKSIAFDYVTDGAAGFEGNRVYLTADAEGTQIIAQATPEVATGALKDPVNQSMEIINSTYKGPIYIYVTYVRRMFIGNFSIVREVPDPEPTQEPVTTQAPETTQAPATTTAPETTKAPEAPMENDSSEKGGCGGSAAVAQVMLILGAALIIKRKK